VAILMKEASEKLSPAAYSQLKVFFKAANARIAEGLFAEIGKSGEIPGGSVVEQIHGIARGMVEKSAGSMTVEQAEAKAWEMHPELYAQYQRERRRGAA